MAYENVKKWKTCTRCKGEGYIYIIVNYKEKKLACPRCPNKSGKIPDKN